MTTRPANLHEACTPLFSYLTTFRRNAETNSASVEDLRDALVREFGLVERTCDGDRKLKTQFDRVKYALVAAVDQVVLGSNWPNRMAWSMQLLELHYFQTSEGGDRFFDFADEVLGDPSNDAAEIAHVLFTCLALGFQGKLYGDRKELERKRQLLFEKARLKASDEKLAPEAYGRNSPRELSKLPTAGIFRFVLVALGAVLFALLAGDAVTSFKNRKANQQIREHAERLDRLNQQER
jgi:type VI secretion system protein ImpK